jgi:hypothetical protein
MTKIQKLAWIYSVLFVLVTASGYVPAFNDADGNLFGLFSLQLHDDLLHLASGLWAAIAAWRSERASIQYFKIFGVVYGLDGILGLITGLGYLDLGIFLKDMPNLDFITRVLTNLPHILIGGSSALIGFFGPRSTPKA